MNNIVFEENPNPNAKIAFVMWTPFHYYVYKNIAKHLPEAEFVICDTWFKNIRERGSNHVQEMVTFLKKENVSWRVIKELFDGAFIEKFFSKYEIIASMWLAPPLDSFSFDDWFSKKKSVRIKYGVGKNLNTFAPWSARFDLTLVEGAHAHGHLRSFTESHIIGCPKFDDWFSGSIDEKKIHSIRDVLDPNRKTILYVPTHSDGSSIRVFGDAIVNLNPQYNVLIKFHYMNPVTEGKEILSIKSRSGILTFDSKDDILPLYAVADVIVSDFSSASLETLLVDKPLVTLDVSGNDDDFFEKNLSGSFNGAWVEGATICRRSVVERIKDDDFRIGEIAKNPHELIDAIERSVLTRELYTKNREYWIDLLFSYRDGRSGERAADIMRDFLSRSKPEPPLLGLSARSYFSILNKNFGQQVQRLENDLREKDRIIENLKEMLKNKRGELKKWFFGRL